MLRPSPFPGQTLRPQSSILRKRATMMSQRPWRTAILDHPRRAAILDHPRTSSCILSPITVTCISISEILKLKLARQRTVSSLSTVTIQMAQQTAQNLLVNVSMSSKVTAKKKKLQNLPPNTRNKRGNTWVLMWCRYSQTLTSRRKEKGRSDDRKVKRQRRRISCFRTISYCITVAFTSFLITVVNDYICRNIGLSIHKMKKMGPVLHLHFIYLISFLFLSNFVSHPLMTKYILLFDFFSTTNLAVCVCVCVCKIGPISARTLSFRHQTSRKCFSHSNFPIPYLWTAFCVPLSFVFYEKQ